MTATAIDIHTHIVPHDFPAYAGQHGDKKWPQMAAAHDCHHRSVMIDGKNFRTVTDEAWDVGRRLEAMSRHGVHRQVLSPMPELLSYWLPDDDAVALLRHVNDTIGGMIDQAPERFIGLGGVPMQNPDLATRELERLMKDGRFRGIEIGTNINGVPIGDPRYAGFFATAEKLGAAIFVHALHPAGSDRIVGPAKTMTYVGFPCETSYAIAGLMTGGILNKHPDLRMAFSHGGGVFGLILPRLVRGCEVTPEIGERIGASPRDLARRLYYDTLVYDTPTIKFLIETFGVTQLCVGTDFPFDIHDRTPMDRLTPLGLNDHDCGLLHHGNARRFLGEAA